jgi:aminopeptidase N
MGDFVNFNEVYTNAGGSFPIDYYVLPKHVKAARKYHSHTKDVIAVYEELYSEYPYKKDGAAMVKNLRCIINDGSLFFAMIRGFYNKYKFKIATTADFVHFAHDFTGTANTDFFNKFLYDTDPPVLKYNFTLENDTLRFYYKWTGVGENFSMPFSITINNKSNFRLIGTTEYQIFETGGVKSFYLPNEKRFNKDQITKNSFTYFWTSWQERD